MLNFRYAEMTHKGHFPQEAISVKRDHEFEGELEKVYGKTK